MQAKDIMTRAVVSVAPDATVEEVAALLLTRRISAVPVVEPAEGGGGRLVGIVSEGDLMRRSDMDTERRASWWLRLLTDREALARDFVKSHGRRARDVMTSDVVTVGEATPLGQIAELLEQRRIKRVPVIEAGRLTGIVSRADLLRALVAGGARPPEWLSDRDIRERLIAELPDQPWSGTAFLSIEVEAGVVRFRGMVESAAEQAALRVYAENLPGVRGVRDETVLRDSQD